MDQRGTSDRRAIARDWTFLFLAIDKFMQLRLDARDLLAKAREIGWVVEAGFSFERRQLGDSGGNGTRTALVVHPQSDRAAFRRDTIGIEQFQAVACERTRHRT